MNKLNVLFAVTAAWIFIGQAHAMESPEYEAYKERLNKAALPNRSESEDTWLRVERENALYRCMKAGDKETFNNYLQDFPKFFEGDFGRATNVHGILSDLYEDFQEGSYTGYSYHIQTWVLELPLKGQKLSDYMINRLLEDKAKKIQEKL